MKIDAIQLAGMLGYIAKVADVDTADSIAAHIAALEQERDAAVADNAALLEALDGATQMLAEYDAAGAEAIDRHVDVTDKSAHPGTALLEEHRKALVHARNEGLEDAAFRVKDDDIAEMIRAMKEPE